MGLPARNPQLLVIQFREAASAAERTSGHGWGGAGILRAVVLSAQYLWQLSEVRRHAAGLVAVSRLVAKRRPGSSSK